MRPLAEAIANAGYTVELPRLPGHGTTVEDMMTTGWADWSGAADAAYRELATRCDRVAVVGLSMGGGLTAFVAEEHPDVTALVFINALVKPPVQEMRDGLKGLLDAGMETMESIGSDIKKEGSQEASYNATPLACAASLFDGIEKVWERLDTISVPTLILSSREDHVVSSDNSEDLARIVTGSVEHIWLEDSYHVATLDNDASLVDAHTVRFLDSIFSA
jgi:carboxylesterase